MAGEEGKRCYESWAVSEYYQLCFGCGDAETVAGKPVVYSNNCFLEESLGSLVIPGFELSPYHSTENKDKKHRIPELTEIIKQRKGVYTDQMSNLCCIRILSAQVTDNILFVLSLIHI